MPAVRNTTSPTDPAPGPTLVPVGQHHGQKPLPLTRLFTLIGSSPSARLFLPSKAVSRCHAVIINTGAGLFVRDLASRTRIRVNGQVVIEADLREGDVLQVGPFTFKFSNPADPDAAAPASSASPSPAPPAPEAALEVEELDQPLPVRGRALLIGRRDTADISLTENSASSAHALIFAAEGKHLLRDLKSRTGTFVNGVKVEEHALSSGDVIRVGETEFRYVVSGSRAEAAAAAPTAEPAAAPVAAVPDAIPDPEPDAPASPTGEGGDDPSRVSDFDFIPLEVAPGEGPPSSPGPSADAPPNGDGPSVGLLEVAEPAAPEAGRAYSEAEGADALGGDETDHSDSSIPLAPADEAAKPRPHRWSQAAAARPHVPTGAGDDEHPARPRSPLDLLSEADDLEPPPEHRAGDNGSAPL